MSTQKNNDFSDSSKGYGDIDEVDAKNNKTTPTQPNENMETNTNNPPLHKEKNADKK